MYFAIIGKLLIFTILIFFKQSPAAFTHLRFNKEDFTTLNYQRRTHTSTHMPLYKTFHSLPLEHVYSLHERESELKGINIYLVCLRQEHRIYNELVSRRCVDYVSTCKN